MEENFFVRSIDSLKGSRLPKSALIGIAFVLVMVAVAAGRLLLDTATTTSFEVVSESQAAAEQEPEQSAETMLRVHVAGAVVNPGVYRIAEGSCVMDAVTAAGGFTEDAVQDGINLARPLNSGEQVVIPDQREPDSAGQMDARGSEPATSLVNLNTATVSDLVSLPGIGEQTAQNIVKDREKNGPFQSPEDVKRVSGIGDRKFEAIASLVTV